MGEELHHTTARKLVVYTRTFSYLLGVSLAFSGVSIYILNALKCRACVYQ